jgi:hypothetical protein
VIIPKFQLPILGLEIGYLDSLVNLITLFGRGYLNSKGAVGSYKTPVRDRGRGYPGGNRRSQRGQYQGYQGQY